MLLLCVHIFEKLGSVIHVYRERSGSVVARVLKIKIVAKTDMPIHHRPLCGALSQSPTVIVTIMPQCVPAIPGQTIWSEKLIFMCTLCLSRHPRFIEVTYLSLMSIV